MIFNDEYRIWTWSFKIHLWDHPSSNLSFASALSPYSWDLALGQFFAYKLALEATLENISKNSEAIAHTPISISVHKFQVSQIGQQHAHSSYYINTEHLLLPRLLVGAINRNKNDLSFRVFIEVLQDYTQILLCFL